MNHERFNQAIETAMEAFWAAIAASMPEVKTGDLDPSATHIFRAECHSVVGKWYEANQSEPEVIVLRGGSLLSDQFPDFPAFGFDPAALPIPLPHDQSYRNDGCPSFSNDDGDDQPTPGTLALYIDHPDPRKRRQSGVSRFTLLKVDKEQHYVELFDCEKLSDLQGFMRHLLRTP